MTPTGRDKVGSMLNVIKIVLDNLAEFGVSEKHQL